MQAMVEEGSPSSLRQRVALLLKLGLQGFERGDLRVERLHVAVAVLAVLLGLADLRVAPTLVGGLGSRLRKEALNELLDQALHLRERVRSHLHGQERDRPALQLLRSRRQDSDRTVAKLHLGIAPMLVDFLLLNKDDIVVLIVGVAIHLQDARHLRGLHQSWLRLGAPAGARGLLLVQHGAAEDLECLADRRELPRASRRPLVPLLRALLALASEILEVRAVVVEQRRVLSQHLLLLRRRGLVVRELLLLGLQRGLGGLDLLALALRCRVEGRLGGLLLLLESGQALLELLQQPVQRVDDTAGVEGVVLLRHLHALRLLQERSDHRRVLDRDAQAIRELQRLLHLRLDAHQRLGALDVADRRAERAHRRRRVRVLGLVNRVLLVADLRHLLQVRLVRREVLVELLDVRLELHLLRLELLQIRRERLNVGLPRRNGINLRVALVLAEARKLVVRLRLSLALLSDLCLQVLEQGQHLLDRAAGLTKLHTRSGRYDSEAKQQLHCTHYHPCSRVCVEL